MPLNMLSQVARDLLTIQDAHKHYSVDLADNGRFPTENRIGEGSFGMAFLGRRARSNQRVVIKIIRCPKDDGVGPRRKITRLLREVLVWSRLNHRNVAEFHGLDFSDANIQQLINADASDYHFEKELRVPGLVSPFFEFSILIYVAKHPDLREACVIDLARGLTYLHKQYVIHGDLRPENIRVDGRGVVKIIDFGFSKLSYCSGFTTKAYTNLDPRFAAPEILFPEPQDVPCRPTFKSDVYSFSMCMLQILAHPDNPRSSVPFNHIRDDDWSLLSALYIEKQRPKRDNYTKAITSHQWRVMSDCWNEHKDKRPGIHQAFEVLSRRKCTGSGWVCWL